MGSTQSNSVIGQMTLKTCPVCLTVLFDHLQLNPTVKLLYVTPEQLVKSK